MTFTVLYDANVLYPNVLRDVLIRLAQTGLVHARWTDRILDETFENLAEDRPDIPAATLTKLRELMNRAVPDCLVTGYEALIPALTLPDEDDRHVLAAAIRAAPRSSSQQTCGTSPTRIWRSSASRPSIRTSS